jgi:hypothetical protein
MAAHGVVKHKMASYVCVSALKDDPAPSIHQWLDFSTRVPGSMVAVLRVSEAELRLLEVLRDVDRGGLPVRAAAWSSSVAFRVVRTRAAGNQLLPVS